MMFVKISLPGLWLELAILMVRVFSMVGISAPESDNGDCSSMFRLLMMLGVGCEFWIKMLKVVWLVATDYLQKMNATVRLFV